jgi:hypothetical protein
LVDNDLYFLSPALFSGGLRRFLWPDGTGTSAIRLQFKVPVPSGHETSSGHETWSRNPGPSGHETLAKVPVPSGHETLGHETLVITNTLLSQLHMPKERTLSGDELENKPLMATKDNVGT